MITRIEIDGFKTFDKFGLDLRPLTAVVGPNASGKSNLFDALRFLSLLAQFDVRTAMQGLRGEPEELFRKTSAGTTDQMRLAIEVFLQNQSVDAFGTTYDVKAQRLRYEIVLQLAKSSDGIARGVVVGEESCFPISKKGDKADYLRKRKISYNSKVNPFIRVSDDRDALLVRQDGRQRHGRPVQLSLKEASRSALSTITTAEFPQLYALRDALSNIRFLEINPQAARNTSDRFEERTLKPDASNLSAALSHLKEETATKERPNGVLSDIALDLSSLIPSVSCLEARTDSSQRQYSFDIKFTGNLEFSSRVISDGTLRLLALLTILNDPKRRGTLCFEEPENGVHEGRVPMLIEFLRNSSELTSNTSESMFQVLLNTHSPKVMSVLKDFEIVAADSVAVVDPESKVRSVRTRMRTGVVSTADMFDPETNLTRYEIEKLLHQEFDAA